ncbi:Male sterility, NAD-binding [Penicillium griseofulvum]|uniref:Male sterility, NAD-binding n=1 Tax=Penicillium patulum TaxID=5078 RepID=A0A135LNZ9_PENPA|nr:Male sterility, NAD-binding [Penicillium griseofulvum]KXG50684.1 Male sterility, NAD-binding [Penicillium griseofulvum]
MSLVEQNECVDVKLTDIGIMTPIDLEKIWEWNKVYPEPIDRCVHEIFEEKAQDQPNAVAICAWDGDLLYGELDELATKLANQLIKLGVGPGVLVPLCFEKSVWTTVAMLGVFKAGGGFVMLDTSFPEYRLHLIVQQVKADLILSSASSQALSSRLARNVVPIDRTFFNSNVQADPRLPQGCPSSVMYLNFTSGSTGTPKGYIVSHRNFASALYHQAQHLGFTKESRVYDFSPYSFDASISHTFTALAAGACLCVPMEQDRMNNLAQSITSLRANVAALTPSVAQLLDPKDTPTLQSIHFLAEPLYLKDVSRWWGKVQVLNIYGPSECTPYSVINSHASCPQEVTRIGIGAGQVTWVVNPDNPDHLLPLGNIGELILEGPLVGEGYWNDPERTSMVFIRDPVWLRRGALGHPGRHGQRLYKTGDLVHYNEDGSLTFVGRKDTQIKIHGQRVEPGEVEHFLQEHMTEAKKVIVDIVIPKEENPSPVLAAFIQICQFSPNCKQLESTCIAEILDISTDIKVMLDQHLPGYMVPSIFFSIRELPTTVAGKLDRRRLREIGTSCFHQFMEREKQMPKPKPNSHLGIQLQKILGKVLAIDPALVGYEDNFFRLGGDSIAAMRVVSEAQKAGIGLTVSDILRYPALGSLVSRCHHVADKAADKIPPFALLRDSFDKKLLLQEIAIKYQLDPAIMEDAYPCTPLQEGLLSLSLKHPGEYMIQRTLELRSTIQTSYFCRVWEKMAQNIPILRTRIVQSSDMDLLQLVLNEEIQWTHTMGLSEYLEVDKKRPMELGQPLARYTIVTDDTGIRRWFVWTLHHALYDGESLSLMIDMASRGYHGTLTKPKHEFKAFVKYIDEQDNDKISDYWHNALVDCDCTPFPALPASVRRPGADGDITHQIPWLNKQPRDVTITTLVRAAWALLASSMTNSKSVVFGIATSGRGAPVIGIDKLVGPTIATAPLYIKILKSQRVRDYLAAVQHQATEMIPFEQFGLHRISKACPGAQQACMFQTLLVIQSQESIKSDSTLGVWEESYEPEWVNTFALALELQIDMKRINARFDSNVIKPWIVQTMLEGLDFVMKQLDTAGSQQSIAEIELVTPRSLEQIWDRNHTVPMAVKESIHHMIERQIEDQPMATAICAWDGQLTYGELDRLSTTVAAQIVKFGIGPHLLGPHIMVPLCFEKSKWAIVSILGVLKSGAGFVLLDPFLPEPRLQSILKRLGSKLLLSSQSSMDLSCRLSDMVIQIGPDLSQISSAISSQTTSSMPLLQPSLGAMYAVFTSGSTGAPKGVLVSHENFCSAVHYQLGLLGFTRKSRVLDLASYAFDAAIHNTIATLVGGGCLCIPSEKDRNNNISDIMAIMRPTIVNLTPTVARLLEPGMVHDLETLILLGEPVMTRDIERWQSHKIQIINAYGPAECTPISTIHTFGSSTNAIRIGKGVGLVTWIVDPEDQNRLSPPACTGELLLEGPLVGNGYMGDLEKTAEAFIEDPEWLLKGSNAQPGRHGRLYKTGDLVQYDEDGSLIFVGRKDSQVKIRGQRFELGEVEHHILNCLPKGSQAVAEVLVPESEINARPVLVAFIQVSGNDIQANERSTLTAKIYPMEDEVKRQLAHNLPSYMVPTVLFSLLELPLTATGKTDRRRLREIGQELLLSEGNRAFETSKKSLEDPCSRPILQTEHSAYALARKVHCMRPSWAQDNLLYREDESQHQHTEFNDVFLHSSGLDSLDMMELLSFISQKFHIQVEMQLLMDKSTSIRSLSEHLVDSQAFSAEDYPVRLSSSRSLESIDLMAEICRHNSKLLSAQQRIASYNKTAGNGLPMKRDKKYSTVLLTGASGFIGTQVLRQLLEHRYVSRVICLVRGDTDEAARHHTIDRAVKALWWTNHHAEKLDVWRGDLSLPNLGLGPTRWDSLASSQAVDSIIHSGTTVHWTKSYKVLEATNVGSSIELLLLAIGVPHMRFLYVTGGRPWDSHEELDVAEELSATDAIAYSQTKFVAEAVIKRAARRDASKTNRIAALNPGWVIGTPTEGFSNPNDYIWRLVATCIKIGAYNATDADGWLSISDATTTATAIVDAALEGKMKTVGEKPVDGITWMELWAIIQGLGYRLQAKEMAEWLALVRADIEATREKHPLWPLAHMIESLQKDRRVVGRSWEKRGSTPLQLKVAIRKSTEFLVKVGFLPTPSAQNQEMKS